MHDLRKPDDAYPFRRASARCGPHRASPPGGRPALAATVAGLGALVTLGGCAHMNEDECLLADWYTIGYEDGATGAEASRVGRHREVCAQHGVAPDFEAYQAGREEGLREFCRPPNGFRQGESGAAYSGVCPADLEPQFLAAYRAGRQLFEVASAVRETERMLLVKQQQLDALKADREAAQAELISDGVTTERRAELLLQVYELSKRQGTVENEIAELRIELDRREERLAFTREASDW